MYSKAIEAELTLQRLTEENEILKQKIKQIEEEEKQKNDQFNEAKGDMNNNSIIQTEVDIDIFKKIQEQMNKRARILDETLSKYATIPSNSQGIISTTNNNTDQRYNRHNENIGDNDLDNSHSSTNLQFNNQLTLDDDILINKTDNAKSNEDNNSCHHYQSQIYKIPSILLDNKIEEIGLYVRLELSYQKLSSVESRIHFITLLKQVLNNIVMLKQTCFTVFLQLFNFIITLLTMELSKQPQNSEVISSLQSLGEFILINKDLSEALRIVIVMLKRLFPTTFKKSIDKTTELHLRILQFFLKKLAIQIRSSHVHISEVFSEVNDFLYSYPPSILTKQIPNVSLYLEIYSTIKTISDELIESNTKDLLIEAVSYVKNKNSTPSNEYISYLEYKLLKKII